MSAWWKATTPWGSSLRQSAVDLAVVPKPSGTSAMFRTTTPWYCGVSSVIRPKPAYSNWSHSK